MSTELKYSNGTAISIGDRVALANGEIGTVVELFADVESLFSSAPLISPLGPPGVLVVTEKGARILLSNLQPDDLHQVLD